MCCDKTVHCSTKLFSDMKYTCTSKDVRVERKTLFLLLQVANDNVINWGIVYIWASWICKFSMIDYNCKTEIRVYLIIIMVTKSNFVILCRLWACHSCHTYRANRFRMWILYMFILPTRNWRVCSPICPPFLAWHQRMKRSTIWWLKSRMFFRKRHQRIKWEHHDQKSWKPAVISTGGTWPKLTNTIASAIFHVLEDVYDQQYLYSEIQITGVFSQITKFKRVLGGEFGSFCTFK